MTPLLFMWSPQFYFPFSGGVAQTIDPDVTWASLVRPEAGKAHVEKRAVQEVASYGTQLGLITEILLEERGKVAGVESDAVRDLRAIHKDIENIKGQEKRAAGQVGPVVEILEARQRFTPEVERLVRQLLAALDQPAALQLEGGA